MGAAHPRTPAAARAAYGPAAVPAPAHFKLHFASARRLRILSITDSVSEVVSYKFRAARASRGTHLFVPLVACVVILHSA